MSQHREKVEIGFGSTFTFLFDFTFTFLMNSDFNFRRARLILTLGWWSGRHECHNIGKRLRLVLVQLSLFFFILLSLFL